MEYLVTNLRNRVYRTTYRGRKYLVAKATLIVPGVLNGSRGPLYYPLEEIQRNADSWTGTPIVVYHPQKDGKPISAKSPEVLENQQIGFIFSANVNGKLESVLYFDEENTRRVDYRVLDALRKNRPMELSTGLYAEYVPAPANAEYKGKPYISVARKYNPDHLAILPDQVGACSIEDGCGLNVNADGRYELGLVTNTLKNSIDHKGNSTSKKEDVMNNPLTDEQRTSMIENLINDCDCWDEEDREVLANFGDEKLQKLVNNVTRTHTNESKSTSTETLDLSSLSMNELEEEIKRRKKMMSANQGGEEESEEVSNQNLSPEEWLENAPDEIKNTFRYAHQIEQEQKDVLVEKLTANIKDGAEKRIQAERLRKRSIDDLKADVDLIPATPAPVLQQQTQNSEEKKTEDADTAWLSNMMNRMTREPEDDPLPLPTINWGSESEEDNIERAGSIQSSVEDPDQWLRSAPAPIREVVQNALKSEKREKDELISSLVENIEDSSKRFKMRDKLEAKPLAELREMLEFIPKEKTPPPRKPNYTGSAAPAVNRLSDTDKEDILPLPSMNYGS